MDLDTNLFRATTLLARRWVSFRLFGSFIFKIFPFSFGEASITLFEAIKPKNLPDPTLSMHFDGFIFILYHHSIVNAFLRWYVEVTAFRFFRVNHPSIALYKKAAFMTKK